MYPCKRCCKKLDAECFNFKKNATLSVHCKPCLIILKTMKRNRIEGGKIGRPKKDIEEVEIQPAVIYFQERLSKTCEICNLMCSSHNAYLQHKLFIHDKFLT
jgi:hypothetical protein